MVWACPKAFCGSKTRKTKVERALRRYFSRQLHSSGIMNGPCLLFLCLLFAKKSTRSFWVFQLNSIRRDNQLLILRLPLTGCVTSEESLFCSEYQFLRICKEKRLLPVQRSQSCCNDTLNSENASCNKIWKML